MLYSSVKKERASDTENLGQEEKRERNTTPGTISYRSSLLLSPLPAVFLKISHVSVSDGKKRAEHGRFEIYTSVGRHRGVNR